MSYLQSAPGGGRHCGWRTTLMVSAGFWLAPGLAGWLAESLLSPQSGWQPLAGLMALSPLLTGGFWAVIGIATFWGLRHGIWGSLPAAVTGAAAGALAATGAAGVFGLPFLIAMGAVMATLHRFTLALLRPMAF